MKYGFLILLLLFSCNAYSQVNCVTDPPLPPVLTSVSILPESGYTSLTWTSSPSADIAAYIIYSYQNGDGFPIDTIRDPLAVSSVIQSTASKYFSVSYAVSAMRLPRCTSIFSNVLNSIFTTAEIDTCNNRITIKWNSYPSTPQRVNSYSVLASVNGGTFSEIASVTQEPYSFTLNNFLINSQYCFIIHSNLSDGSFSGSNMACVLTKIPRKPAWINADQATINSSGIIAVSFTIDPTSELNHFILERKSGRNGAFEIAASPAAVNGSVTYTDNQANADSINYYRLSAINSCGIPVTTSNIASNIVLRSAMTGKDVSLEWNPYRNWEGIVSGYHLYVNTGNGFAERTNIPASDSSLLLDYKQIMYEITGDEVCFYVVADESSNPHGISGESVSSTACMSPLEKVTVPNVFTPDNDLINDKFRPVLSFVPADYHLTIINRRGVLLFESRDYLEEWDGSLKGSPEPPEVCIWSLKITTPSGKIISKTGTVTIIR